MLARKSTKDESNACKRIRPLRGYSSSRITKKTIVVSDRDSHFGKLDKAMDAAPKEGWVLISMKDDWKQIFPDQ